MSIVILRFAAALYAVAAGAYIIFFARPRHRARGDGRLLVLAAAFVVHAAAIGIGCSEFGGAEFFSAARRRSCCSSGSSPARTSFLQRYYKLPAVGAFVTPLVARRAPARALRHAGPARASRPRRVRHPTRHASTSSPRCGGVALFAIAFGVALMYLLQEREVKGKHFGALFSRLPSLDVARPAEPAARPRRVRRLHGRAHRRAPITAQRGLEERLVVGPAAGRLARASGSCTARWCSSATAAGTAGATRS